MDQRVYYEAAAAVQGDVGRLERERITYSYFSNDPVSTRGSLGATRVHGIAAGMSASATGQRASDEGETPLFVLTQ